MVVNSTGDYYIFWLLSQPHQITIVEIIQQIFAKVFIASNQEIQFQGNGYISIIYNH